MAAPGVSPMATPLEIAGLDPYRAYSEDPQVGGWREQVEPIRGRRYWHHIGMRLTTWSLVELLRLNGLEDFLLLGQWGVFVAVPENTQAYEDRDWCLPYFDNEWCSGAPAGKFGRGEIFVSLGFPQTGTVEILVPDKDEVVVRRFARIRLSGFRLVQRLPARDHNDDLAGMAAVTVPMFRVRPDTAGDDPRKSALIVSEERDPRSTEMGYVQAGTTVGLIQILGTRAQLARVTDSQQNLWGGWISLFLLDGTPTLERVLPDTENMKLGEQLKAEIARIEAMRAAAIANGEDPDAIGMPNKALKFGDRDNRLQDVQAEERPFESTKEPPLRSKKPVEYGVEQRTTVTGGWRMILDKVWTRPVFIAPIAGRMTWGLKDVIASGGLDDLLLSRSWEICVVDPIAVEAMKDKDWAMRVYGSASMSGQPIFALPKGTFVIVQVFHAPSAVAMLLLPPARPGEECGVGYAYYNLPDGRPVLRALLPQAPQDQYAPDDEQSLPTSAMGYAEPPEGDVLEGPFFAEPPAGQPDLMVSIGQDIGSDHWARLPRGYSVAHFAEILGFRARLPDIEGGGWVSLFGTDGAPLFRKLPLVPPKLELPGQQEAQDELERKLPIVWPGLGVVWPTVPDPVVPVVESNLPSLLYRLGGNRALCDWDRIPLLPTPAHIYRNALTNAQAHLDDLLRHQIWKIAFVESPELIVRERMDPRSPPVITLPRGALVIAEWVAPGAVARLLIPGRADDPRPLHAWADLGTARGPSLSPLSPGGNFWVEPLGGHLPEEQQRDDPSKIPMKVDVRVAVDPDAAAAGYLQRGDAVQIADIRGRRVRLVHTKCIVKKDTAPQGGWVDLFDESGWSVLRARYPGEEHPRELELRALEEIAERNRVKEIPRKRVGAKKTTLPTEGVAPVAEEADEAVEDESVTEDSSEGAAELPALLWQLGELENKSVWTRDWRECIDPIWGQRYFVNKWSGQIVHRLANFGVACPAVRFTVWFSNLSFEGLRQELGDAGVAKRIKECERVLHKNISALADVDEDRVEVQVLEGAEGRQGDDDNSALDDSSLHEAEKEGFRVVAIIRAPGARSSWASAALKQAMADADRFTRHMLVMISNTPDYYPMRVDPYENVSMIKADLEELDIPRVARAFEAPPPPPPEPPLPVQAQFEELRKSYAFTKQKLLHFHCKRLGLGDTQALAAGLQTALPSKPLEELGMWGCMIGDGGAFAMAKALKAGCGANLQTLLLDENGITAAGATALGAGLVACKQLRELAVSKNPIGTGFPKLLAGLGAALHVLDATATEVDDAGATAAAACFRRWPELRSLRLGRNMIGPLGVEAVARALLGAPSVKLADLTGANDGGDWPRLNRVLRDGGVDPARMRIR